MKITESKLRSMIRKMVKESYSGSDKTDVESIVTDGYLRISKEKEALYAREQSRMENELVGKRVAKIRSRDSRENGKTGEIISVYFAWYSEDAVLNIDVDFGDGIKETFDDGRGLEFSKFE